MRGQGSLLPPFTGGLAGCFAWDAIACEKPNPHLDARDEEGSKVVGLMLFDQVIAFDHYSRKIILIVNTPCENPDRSCEAGKTSLRALRAGALGRAAGRRGLN